MTTKIHLKDALYEILQKNEVYEYALHSKTELRRMVRADQKSFVKRFNISNALGREDYLSGLVANEINANVKEWNILSQKHLSDYQGRFIPDMIIQSNQMKIDEFNELKHFSPLQNKGSVFAYLKSSLAGPLKDAEKLFLHEASSFYLTQLQLELLSVEGSYNSAVQECGFIRAYLHHGHLPPYNKKYFLEARKIIEGQNRISNLIFHSRRTLDNNLLYGAQENTLVKVDFTISAKIHYLISGPFQLRFDLPLSRQLPLM